MRQLRPLGMTLLKRSRALAALGCLLGGCGSHSSSPPPDGGPGGGLQPTIAAGRFHRLSGQRAGKLDVLFVVDNSPSMADKQPLLVDTVPDVLGRLLAPACVDVRGKPIVAGGQIVSAIHGVCAQGTPEFPPVHDLHVGVLSSSLGGRGGDQCDPSATNPIDEPFRRHNDDRGHLLNRAAADEQALGDAGSSHYLAWSPTDGAPAQPSSGAPVLAAKDALVKDFQDLVGGVHAVGCGFPSPLESMYHFLVQPDPYDAIVIDPQDAAGRRRTYAGVDKQILVQRHDFLREDSAVLIVLVTDKEDASIDPLSVGGQGWAYLNSKFPGSCGGGAARATSACASVMGRAGDGCTTCGFAGHETDPSCQKLGDTCMDASGVDKPQAGYYPANDDSLAIRFFRMKERFGVDPQYPIKRYVDGLGGRGTVPIVTVPDRTGEHTRSGVYQDTKNCRNPLFAKGLPTDPAAELCNLEPGPRTREEIAFVAIAGVPWQLLTEGDDAASAFKTTLSSSDWTRIVGADPNRHDYTGVDPHMWQAVQPNDGPRASLPPPTAADDADPASGREWETAGADLQFACTFPLPQPKDCSDPVNAPGCDCVGSRRSPLCKVGAPSTQVRAKAYPSIRALTVARDLGVQGAAASICPRSIDSTSPDYGYRPAVATIANKVRQLFPQPCLPDPPATYAGCVALELLASPGDESACAAIPGLSTPSQAVLDDVHLVTGANDRPICLLQQVPPEQLARGTCTTSASPGWCMPVGDAAGGCSAAIAFSPTGAPPPGATLALYCP